MSSTPTRHQPGRQAAVALSWSGGKDCALALHEMGGARLLLTTITRPYQRVTMHGVRRQLVRAQAQAMGLTVWEVMLPAHCSNEVYEARMATACRHLREAGIDTVAFGDLHLVDVRAYREAQMARAGMRAAFPLWGREPAEVVRRFVELGFRAVVVCVDVARVDPSWLGRPWDEALVAALPPGVDPCGEHGELHTFVYDGPIFRHPVGFRQGRVVTRDGFAYLDLVPSQGVR